MKGFKKFLSLILVAASLFTLFTPAFAAEERKVVDSGFCGAQGENLTWALYDDGELIISGEGEMKNYYYYENVAPWKNYASQVKIITIEEGVTSFGPYTFSGCTDRTLVNLPKSLKALAERNSFDYAKNKALVICYAGSQEDWSKVEYKIYDIFVDYEDETWFEKAHTDSDYGYNFSRENKNLCVKMYFNGEKPQIFCEVYCKQEWGEDDPGDDVEVFAHYYLNGSEAEKIVWYSSNGGVESKIAEIPAGESTKAVVTIPEAEMGDIFVRAEVVDCDGKIIASSESHMLKNGSIDRRTLKEKIIDELQMANFTVFFTTFFIILPIVAGPIVTPISLIIQAIKALFE